MKIFGMIAFVFVIALVAALVGVYVEGSHLPLDHSVSVTGLVPAPQEKVFALITNVAKASAWRPAVKSVTVLHDDQKRDYWVEHLAYGQSMTFLALRTDPPTLREVQLDDPKAAYGGAWTYELSPGPLPGTTTLRITEAGFIKPPMYRFVMARIVGPTRNLDQYMKDIQAAAAKP